MSYLNSTFDNEIDSFLSFDQSDYTPVSSSSNSRPVPSLYPQSSVGSSVRTFATSTPQEIFSAPSFQYDAYKQQTGLPRGALANTFAVNQASGLQYYPNNGGFVMPTETLNIPLHSLDDFDFARNTSHDMSDVDFDADSPADLPTMFYPPNALEIQSATSSGLIDQQDSSLSAPVQRMYPGMHSQQAAAQKAMQAQKAEIMRQQQLEQKPLHGQQALPSHPKAQPAKDPHVEESISRLLSQMRQNSAVPAEEADSPDSAAGMSNMARIKKDEDEMDEDERLLASEEGKKLSSKERRQLRNKVSARAFRSRRKGKISLLSIPQNFTDVHQNISANLKARLQQKFKKRMTSALRIVNSRRRTRV